MIMELDSSKDKKIGKTNILEEEWISKDKK
jgi:hypothetical protein